MNSGTHEVIGPVSVNPSRLLNQPCWNTRTITPKLAATESRFRMIALIGTTIDRNVTSSSRNAAESTNAST